MQIQFLHLNNTAQRVLLIKRINRANFSIKSCIFINQGLPEHVQTTRPVNLIIMTNDIVRGYNKSILYQYIGLKKKKKHLK